VTAGSAGELLTGARPAALNPHRPRAPGRRLLAVLVAAAVVLGAALWLIQRDTEPGPGPLYNRADDDFSFPVPTGLMRENEALMRGSLLLALEQWAKLQAGEELGEEPIKRGGRLEAISATLEPFTQQLDDAAIRRLSVALSVVVGIEAHVVFRDIWGLDDDQARGISLWMARVLAEATADGR
jgi:hypothetical protein